MPTMVRIVFSVKCCLLAGLLTAGRAAGEETNDEVLWPSLDEIRIHLEECRRKHPGILKLETIAHSPKGHPVYAVRITEPSIDAADKEHVLITTLHSGVERIGVTSALSLIDWLVSEDSLPRQVRSKQLVVVVPIVNPDGYVSGSFANGQGKDSYTNWNAGGPVDPENMPEAVAVQKLIDELQPEVHADIHGMDLGFQGYLLSESSGAAWSNLALRPYHRRIMELMNEAALTEGYGSSRLEEDAEKLYWGPQLNGIAENKLWYGRPRPYAALYSYNRYHSLILASEIGWERSAVLRHGRLLQVGNEQWPGEFDTGYPTRIIVGTEMHRITAWGKNAAERRRSRVELWNKQSQLRIGFANPQMQGRFLCAVTTGSKAANEWMTETNLELFGQKLAQDPGFNVEPILKLIDRHPKHAGQWGARPNLAIEGSGEQTGEETPLDCGFAIRLRIPFANAKIADLRLNGHPVAESGQSKSRVVSDRGYTVIEIPIERERAKQEDLFVVTCEYDPVVRRQQGWSRLKDSASGQ